MLKIGVLTFHRADNYGAVLQNMALINIVSQFNDNNIVQTIDYRSPKIEAPYNQPFYQVYTHNPVKFFVRVLRNLTFLHQTRQRKEKFNLFRVRYCKLTRPQSVKQLVNNELNIDLFITGSDQVWNSTIADAQDEKVFSLEFVHDKRKISYAASAGNINCLNSSTEKAIAKLDEISVREVELKKYLEKKLKRKVRLDVDPVFLLGTMNWNSMLPKRRIYKQPYIFVYSVGDQRATVNAIARKISRQTGLKIASVDYLDKFGKRGTKFYGASPLEFVQLIRDAEYVVASSFHAVAFSIIFKKKFVVIPHAVTGSRISNLLEVLGLSDRIVKDSSAFFLKEINNSFEPSVDRRLSELRKQSVEFLNKQTFNNFRL